jgi:hypothetical protein
LASVGGRAFIYGVDQVELGEALERLVEDSSVLLVDDVNFHLRNILHVTLQFLLTVQEHYGGGGGEVVKVAVASDLF